MSYCVKHGGDCSPDAACWTEWQEVNAKLSAALLQNDEYRKALEEINALPAGANVEELVEIRFRAINISYKALRPTALKRFHEPKTKDVHGMLADDGPGHKCDVCGLIKQDTFETCRDCYMAE